MQLKKRTKIFIWNVTIAHKWRFDTRLNAPLCVYGVCIATLLQQHKAQSHLDIINAPKSERTVSLFTHEIMFSHHADKNRNIEGWNSAGIGTTELIEREDNLWVCRQIGLVALMLSWDTGKGTVYALSCSLIYRVVKIDTF